MLSHHVVKSSTKSLLHLTRASLLSDEDKGRTVKIDGKCEPKSSHVWASDKINLLHNEGSGDLCVMGR